MTAVEWRSVFVCCWLNGILMRDMLCFIGRVFISSPLPTYLAFAHHLALYLDHECSWYLYWHQTHFCLPYLRHRDWILFTPHFFCLSLLSTSQSFFFTPWHFSQNLRSSKSATLTLDLKLVNTKLLWVVSSFLITHLPAKNSNLPRLNLFDCIVWCVGSSHACRCTLFPAWNGDSKHGDG